MVNYTKFILLSIVLVFGLGILSAVAQSTQSGNWEAPEEVKSLENPLESSAQIISAGKSIFSQLCAPCHGNKGKGDGMAAGSLKPRPTDLTLITVQQQAEGVIYWKIREGRPPMPPFKQQLNEKQVWALVTFIKSLENSDQNREEK